MDVTCEVGFAGASLTAVCSRAKVSRGTFYELFDSREECFLGVLNDGYRQVSDLLREVLRDAERWRDAALVALSGLLSFFDAEPSLTRVWFIESLAAGTWALERRERNLAALTQLVVEHWPAPADCPTHPLAAAGVMAAVIGVIQAHVVLAQPEPLLSLLGPLMGIVTAPYVDVHAVAAEIERGQALSQQMLSGRDPSRKPRAVAVEVPDALRDPRAHRARQCLLHLAAHPGASNHSVATAVGVSSHSQISMLLRRLERLGLLDKRAGRPGHPNAWSLTPHGCRVVTGWAQGQRT